MPVYHNDTNKGVRQGGAGVGEIPTLQFHIERGGSKESVKKGKIIPLSALLDLIILAGSEGCKKIRGDIRNFVHQIIAYER
jgi:hypothetical protein